MVMKKVKQTLGKTVLSADATIWVETWTSSWWSVN